MPKPRSSWPGSTLKTKRLAAELSKLAGPQLRIEDDLAAAHWSTTCRRCHPGVDRLLAAAGAWSLAKQAVIIVDAGTAITVDFVDGEGTFHGGAIAPGLGLMLNALAEGTDALPSITFQSPSDDDPFGADTESAMRLGVHLAARGLISQAIERYALAYGAWPKVLATGETPQPSSTALKLSTAWCQIWCFGACSKPFNKLRPQKTNEYGECPDPAPPVPSGWWKWSETSMRCSPPSWDANRHPSDSCGVNPLATSTTDWCTASRKMARSVFPTPAPWWFGCWWKHSSLKVPHHPTCRRLPGSGLPNRVVVAGHTGARDQSGRRGPAADPWGPP